MLRASDEKGRFMRLNRMNWQPAKVAAMVFALLAATGCGRLGATGADDTGSPAPDTTGGTTDTSTDGGTGGSTDGGTGTSTDGGTGTGTDAGTDTGAPDVFPTAPAGGNWNPTPENLVQHVHLTWQRDPSTAQTFMWETPKFNGSNVSEDDVKQYQPKVWLVEASRARGEGPTLELPFVEAPQTGQGEIYQELVAGRPVGEGKYVQWEVEATGLKPNTDYFYRVGTWKSFDAATGAFVGADISPVYKFKTGLPKGSREPFMAILAGDSRGGYAGIKEQIERFATRPARFWMFNGDMNNLGRKDEWQLWFDAMGPLLDGVTFMPVQGNHETFADNYYTQFALPRDPSLAAEWQEHVWSIDFANVHVIGLDSNTDTSVKSTLDWLKADLVKAGKDPDIDWIIAGFHHPVYSSGTVHGSTQRLIDNWSKVFADNKVDLTFAGHDHIYERTKPLDGSGNAVTPGQPGVRYIVAGSFWSPPYNVGTTPRTEVNRPGDGQNYVEMEVTGKTLKLTAYTGDGKTVIDTTTLTKP
jgi:hypothetical protein